MSTQSILNNNIESQREYFLNKNLSLGRDYIVYKRFMLGSPLNFGEMMFVKTMNRLLCTDNCELKDWIFRKIKGKLEDCEIKVKNKPTISDLFKIYQQQVEACSLTEVVNSCCDWEQIEW